MTTIHTSRADLSNMQPMRVIEEAVTLIQIFATALTSANQETSTVQINTLCEKVVSAIAFASNTQTSKDLITHLISELPPETQDSIYTSLLGERTDDTNLSTTLSLPQKLKIMEQVFQSLSAEEKISLLNNLRHSFPNSVTDLVPPREAMLPKTYAKLILCAAVTGTFAARLFSQSTTKTQAALGLVPLATTLTPLIFGFKKTENAIEKTETFMQNLGILITKKVCSTATRLKTHVYNNRRVYLPALGAALFTAGGIFAYKAHIASLKIETTPILDTPLPIPAPPNLSDTVDIEPPTWKVIIPEITITPNHSKKTPFLDQTVREMLRGSIALPICELGSKLSPVLELLVDGAKAAQLTAQIFGGIMMQETSSRQFPV